MSASTIAADFLAACTEAGLTPAVDAERAKVTITHRFTPGDTEGFLVLDCTATSALHLLPCSSVFGVDGVAGDIALRNGFGAVKAVGVKPSIIKALTSAL